MQLKHFFPRNVRNYISDQVPEPGENAPHNSGTSSLASVSDTGNQASDTSSTVGVPKPQHQLGPPQHGPSRGIAPLGQIILDDPSHKWVQNLSRTPLTPAQRSLPAKGSNYAVAPRHPPHLEYITAIESVCPNLSQQDAKELRAIINRVPRGFWPPKSNPNREEIQAIRELKKDKSRIVLTANTGVAMVVMVRLEYINKSNNLAQPALQANTYGSY